MADDLLLLRTGDYLLLRGTDRLILRAGAPAAGGYQSMMLQGVGFCWTVTIFNGGLLWQTM